MRPPAYVVHRLASRTRLRVPDLSRDHERCDFVVEALSHCPEVVAVRANPVTASIVLEHDDDALDRIAAYARDLNLFDLEPQPPGAPAKAPGIVMEHALARVDAWVRAETGDRSTLGSVAVMALLAGAVWQAARGQVLPAATTLVWYALALAPPRARQLLESGEEKASARESEGQLAEVDSRPG
jgi:Heavy metal associated domain 2